MNQPPTQPQSDPVEDLIDYFTPTVLAILRRLDAEEFTTAQFIDALLTDPEAAAAYWETVRRWGEREHYSKMVVHGQVVPVILRRSGFVDWAGFAHGEPDEFAVPAWWRLRPNRE